MFTISKNNDKTVNPQKPMIPIGIIANFLELSPKTLRFYEKSKILIPAKTSKKRKLYSLNDLEKGKVIKYLSIELGVNMVGIKIIFCLLTQLRKTEPEKHIEYINKLVQERESS